VFLHFKDFLNPNDKYKQAYSKTQSLKKCQFCTCFLCVCLRSFVYFGELKTRYPHTTQWSTFFVYLGYTKKVFHWYPLLATSAPPRTTYLGYTKKVFHWDIVSNIGAPTYQLSKHLSGLLNQLTGRTAHHVKNSFHLIEILKSVKIKPGDLMVSFDVVSLFTKVPVEESITLLTQHFNKEILALFKHVLTSTYFCIDGQFYEQTE
jgi:hypothetical protein